MISLYQKKYETRGKHMTEDLRSTPMYQFVAAKCWAWRQAGYWFPGDYVLCSGKDRLVEEFVQDTDFAWVQICGLIRNPDANLTFVVLNTVASDLGFQWGLALTVVHEALMAACGKKRGSGFVKTLGWGALGTGVIRGGIALVSYLMSTKTESTELTPPNKKNRTAAAKRKGTRKK